MSPEEMRQRLLQIQSRMVEIRRESKGVSTEYHRILQQERLELHEERMKIDAKLQALENAGEI